MPASPADSALYRSLFGDEETAQLFTDSAEVRAMMLVLGALAQVQGARGMIPETAAAFLHRASRELQIDPSALATATAQNGVPVPALIAAFRAAANAPEHCQYLHWGSTSQDVMDTGLALRLKRAVAIWDARLGRILARLGDLAMDHADLAMTGRTYGQAATATSFGAVVASWGRPLLRARLTPVLEVSLSGAAGTNAAMGPGADLVRTDLGRALGLADPGSSWHSERDGMATFAAQMAGLAGSLGKIGQDVILLTQSGISEVALAGAGGSSTMPQKQNPVLPSVLVALARQTAALAGVMQGAVVHGHQRDGAAWFAEWLSLPQLCILTGAALRQAEAMLADLSPNPAAMAANLAQGNGLIYAEAISFILAAHMPRADAQAAVKALCDTARAQNADVMDLARARWPEQDWSSLRHDILGRAPSEARAFARSALER